MVLQEARRVRFAASGQFGAGREQVVATVRGPWLWLWDAERPGAPARERARELLQAPVLCLHAVRRGGADMLFVLHADLRWRLLTLDPSAGGLRVRAMGTLEPPPREPAGTLFARRSVPCCALHSARVGGSAVALAVWDRWLTVLPLERTDAAVHTPLARAGALPTSASLPARVVRMATWAPDGAGDSAADPQGNPALALLYADDALRLLSVQCVNLDLDAPAVLPGPWGMQNIGVVEAEASCRLVPLISPHRDRASGVGSGVVVVGQGMAAYVSGDGEQSAQIALAKAMGSTEAGHGADGWDCCQLPALAGDAGCQLVLLRKAAGRSAGCVLDVTVATPAARMHCGSGGAATVELSGRALGLPPQLDEVSRQGGTALVGMGPSRAVGCTADGAVVDLRKQPDGRTPSVEATLLPMMAGWTASSSACGHVTASAFVRLTRRLAGSPATGASVCEGAVAVCGTDGGHGAEGGCVMLGRLGCARVPTAVASAITLPELPTALHGISLPDGTALVLCSLAGATRGTQVFCVRAAGPSGSPSVDAMDIDSSAPTLAVGCLGRAGMVQVTDECLHLVPVSPASAPRLPWPVVAAPGESGEEGPKPIGAAAVSEAASLVAVSVGREIVCCRAGSGSGPAFVEVGRFSCSGGEPAALAFHAPGGAASKGRRTYIGYAEWGSNCVGVLDAQTLQPVCDDAALTLPSLCRSMVFFSSGNTIWMLCGLADGLLACCRTSLAAPGSSPAFVLEYTVRVGSSPVALHCVAQGTQSDQPPFVYAASSRDMAIFASSEMGDALEFGDVDADDRTLSLVPIAIGDAGYGSVVWLTHPPPGHSLCSELCSGFVDVAREMRWRRRDLVDQTPLLVEFHPASHTLVVVSRCSSSSTSTHSTLRVLDAETLDQLAAMELEPHHTVMQLLVDLPEGLLPESTSCAANILMASSLQGGAHEQSLLSVLRITVTRPHDAARRQASISLTAQHNLGGGSSSVARAMCPYQDRHGAPVLAVARGCDIEVLRLNDDACDANATTVHAEDEVKIKIKERKQEETVGSGHMNVTRVTRTAIGNGCVARGLSTAGQYMVATACSRPGQAILRWHDDFRLAPQLLVVARDSLAPVPAGDEERAEGQRARAAAAVHLVPACADAGPQKTDCSDPGAAFFAVAAPLQGGLRVFKHSPSAELPLEAPAPAPAPAPEPAPVVLAGGADAEVGAGAGAEAAAAPPAIANVAGQAVGPAAAQQAGDASGADGDSVAIKACAMQCWSDTPPEAHSQSTAVGLHEGFPGMAAPPSESAAERRALTVVRSDGTIQVQELPGAASK